MPKGKDRLSAVAVRTARFVGTPTKLFDGGGLFLHVQESGKYWRLKYRFDGKEKLLSLGVYPDVELRLARQGRDGARQLLAQGIDPGTHRRAQKSARRQIEEYAFEVVAREWWQQVHSRSVVKAHADRNLRRLEVHMFPYIGGQPVGQISAPQLLAALRNVAQVGHFETAHRLRSLAGQVFRYAIATGRAERDVAADLRDALPPAPTQHQPP